MISLVDFIKEFSKEYSVQHFDDVESGVFVENIKGDIYLMKDVSVK